MVFLWLIFTLKITICIISLFSIVLRNTKPTNFDTPLSIFLILLNKQNQSQKILTLNPTTPQSSPATHTSHEKVKVALF
jgi:hypothetical protein